MHRYHLSRSLVCIVFVFLFLAFRAHSQPQQRLISGKLRHCRFDTGINRIAQLAHLAIYTLPEMHQVRKKLTYCWKNTPLNTALDSVFENTDLAYELTATAIRILPKIKATAQGSNSPAMSNIKGRVTDINGLPVCRASITVKGTKPGTATDTNGRFIMYVMPGYSTLTASCMGYCEQTIGISNKTEINITLTRKYESLPAIVTPYTSVSLKQNTGNIVKIPKDRIHAAVAPNLAEMLYGQAPGLLVSQSNGNTGSRYRIQLDGQSTLSRFPGRANLPYPGPLIIIDGIPLCTGNDPISLLTSAAGNPGLPGIAEGGLDALAFLNTLDIEDMYLLKDADATAIYGSRGANGVMVITTRHGRPGNPRFSLDISSGFGNIINTTRLMNTSQYLNARSEAFRNDGVIPTAQNAPDIVLWGSDHNTDFKKLLVGGTSFSNRAYMSYSGADDNAGWYVSGGFRRESSVFSPDLYYIQRSLNSSFTTKSKNKKFSMELNANASYNTSNSISTDLMPGTKVLPNLPALEDPAGHYIRSYKGVGFSNPLLWRLNRYTANIGTLISSLNLRDTILKGLVIKLTLGGNWIDVSETSIFPIAALDSTAPRLGKSYLATNSYKSWIAEPQLQYRFNINKLTIALMTGASFQQVRNNQDIIKDSGYASDDLLLSQAAAPHMSFVNTPVLYKYAAAFGSLNLAWDNTLFFNFTGRRDGSSRFGPDNRMANFGAIGTNWIIRNYTSCNDSIHFISFFRIRGSVGITGNDQIGDYAYLDSWKTLPASRAYDGLTGLTRDGISNSSFSWEKTLKWSISANLELLKKIKLEAGWHCNRSTNLLISDVLPAQTGFSQQGNKNSPAVIQNTGTDFIVSMDSIKIKKTISISFRLQVSVPFNKLVSFPSLAASNYAGSLIVGKSVTEQRALHALGVDPATGLMMFKDISGDGRITQADYIDIGNTDVKCAGGLSAAVRWNNLQLGIGLEGRIQPGLNPLYANLSPDNPTGLFLSNQTTDVLGRWKNPGDITNIQRLTTGAATPAGTQAAAAFNNSKTSNLLFTDASFLRLKTISLSVLLPPKWTTRLHLEECRFYAEVQNLLTLTHYRGTDPVTQDFNAIPPLKTITCGIHVTI